MSDELSVIRFPGTVDPPVPRTGVFPNPRGSYGPLVIGTITVLFALSAKGFGPAWAQTILADASLSNASDAASLGTAFIASILLHEMGHLVAALVLRFDVLALNLGPLRYSRNDGRWTLQWKAHGWWSASVVAVPSFQHRGDRERWRRDMLLVIAAGPAATFLAMVLPVLLLLLSGPGVSGRTAVAFLAELNAILFVLGLIPNGAKATVRNDASLLGALLSNGAEGREILLYQMLVQLTLQGFRPCFYPERLIREMAASHTRADFSTVFAEAICHWAWDRGDLVTAEAWLERAAEAAAHCEDRILSRALSQYACFCLIVHRDRTRTRLHLASVQLNLLSPAWLRHRTAAVAALAERRDAQAGIELRQAQASMQQQSPYFEFERKLIRGLTALSAETV